MDTVNMVINFTGGQTFTLTGTSANKFYESFAKGSRLIEIFNDNGNIEAMIHTNNITFVQVHR